MDQRPDDLQPPRLTATMASQRLLVLDFVRRYFARWHSSPSLGEIANALDIDRMKVKRAIRSLANAGMIRHTPGPRGLALPDAEADALRQLRSIGWIVDEEVGRVTKATLLPPAALDYVGPSREGEVDDGTDIAPT